MKYISSVCFVSLHLHFICMFMPGINLQSIQTSALIIGLIGILAQLNLRKK